MKISEEILKNMEVFQETINYKFSDVKLLINAFTHSSYANENKDANYPSNERLEFLGDAVLSIIVSDYIFKNYPDLPEGELTRIRASVVCELSLAQCTKKLGVGKYMLLGKGEELTGGRERISILSDAFEAILAAIYLDGQMEAARKWALEQLEDTIKSAVNGTGFKDYKTELQEYVQKNSDEKVEYEVIEEKGPDHDKRFFVRAVYHGNSIGTGNGRSKKEAEQNAAKSALESLNK